MVRHITALVLCTSFVATTVCSGPSVALATPSCGSGGPLGEGIGSVGPGTFRYRVPSTYVSTTAIPLLLALHGDEGSPDNIYSVFRSLQSSTNGAFLLVAPKAPYAGGSWYQAVAEHTDFVNQLIAKLLASYNIDQDRLWITGWSGGASFLGYYAIKRQDILAATVFHLGASGSYNPPPGSCKIPARFVIGSEDFLYSMTLAKYKSLKQYGHEVVWIELPGVGHVFKQSTLPETWNWLKAKTLCNTTAPGSCNPAADSGAPPASDSGVPVGVHDSGVTAGDGGVSGDIGPPSLIGDSAARDALDQHASPEHTLAGGCRFGGINSSSPPPSVLLVILAVALALRCRRRVSRS